MSFYEYTYENLADVSIRRIFLLAKIYSISQLPFFFLLQVHIEGSGATGWLDASHVAGNWLKYVRSTANPHAVNMRHVLINGQVIIILITQLYLSMCITTCTTTVSSKLLIRNWSVHKNSRCFPNETNWHHK